MLLAPRPQPSEPPLLRLLLLPEKQVRGHHTSAGEIEQFSEGSNPVGRVDEKEHYLNRMISALEIPLQDILPNRLPLLRLWIDQLEVSRALQRNQLGVVRRLGESLAHFERDDVVCGAVEHTLRN
jgi:hypothetical protein